ncbi:MAG: Rieske 2Fe-2S domain-containing protein [Bdellovibrionaceae bacterium]|nr:Rieske 2Fe-2S domain-containing protein [Bdellovibrionales bacterium]MCB9254138.1 Rieske 2Fe-2S domain-containing protein [Pseudobdellovibrionaceae bacterium]
MLAQLLPGWYVVASLRELSFSKPNALRRFGVDWVLWQHNSKEWVMQPDRCPHRSAKLSLGRIDKNCIQCPFHGFSFSANGDCTFAPELERSAPGLSIPSKKLKLFEGFLWFNHEIADNVPIPWFEDLPGTYRGSEAAVDWNQHYSRCVENQLDYSHVPFVHRKTIGRGQSPSIKVPVEADEKGIRLLVGQSTGKKTDIHFLFPVLWRLKVQGRMMPFIAFCPIDNENTRFYLRTYQSFVTLPIFATLIGWVQRWFSLKILSEDHFVVIGQRPKQVLDATDERLFPSDAAIREYRKRLDRTV